MTILFFYLAISLVLLYLEAVDCYRTSSKFNLGESLIFSLGWIVSLPLSIYMIWREGK